MENNPFAKSSDVNTVVFQEPRVENVVKLPLAPLGEAPSITKALEEFKLAVNKLAVPTEALTSVYSCVLWNCDSGAGMKIISHISFITK